MSDENRRRVEWNNVVAIVGIVTGAITALATVWITAGVQADVSHNQWLRDTRQQAYFDYYTAYETYYNGLKTGNLTPEGEPLAVYEKTWGLALVADPEVQEAAWNAVTTLNDFPEGKSREEVDESLRVVLDAFREDLRIGD